MRLSIDPYPILLMDKEILYRYFDSMTEPYSETFVEKYIDKETIKDYKKTNIYKNAYDEHIREEKLNITTYEIVNYKYIDTSKKEEILKKIHLLSFGDRYASYIAFSCKKVIRIYSDIIMFIYHTDRECKKNNGLINLDKLIKYKKYDNKYNLEYGETYISIFEFQNFNGTNETFFVEHMEKLNDNDINDIKSLIGKS